MERKNLIKLLRSSLTARLSLWVIVFVTTIFIAALSLTFSETKETVKKVAAKSTAKKSAPAKAELKENVFVQFYGKEFNTQELAARVKEIWTGQMGHKESELKSLTLYVKPEESAAYYVINDDVTGKVEL